MDLLDLGKIEYESHFGYTKKDAENLRAEARKEVIRLPIGLTLKEAINYYILATVKACKGNINCSSKLLDFDRSMIRRRTGAGNWARTGTKPAKRR